MHHIGYSAYLRAIELVPHRVADFESFPFSVPALRRLERLEFTAPITFFVGENGTGKSTLLEAIAVLAGFSALGGAKYFPRGTEAPGLQDSLRLIRGPLREKDGFFLRAETYFDLGRYIDGVADTSNYGGPVHTQSHGNAFLNLVRLRFRGEGLYLLDEPEAALSPSRQLALLRLLHDLGDREHSQLIVATHSPILMACPNSTIWEFSDDGIRAVQYRETEHFQVMARFMERPEFFVKRLLT